MSGQIIFFIFLRHKNNIFYSNIHIFAEWTRVNARVRRVHGYKLNSLNYE